MKNTMPFKFYILWASNKGEDTDMTEVLMLMDESKQTEKLRYNFIAYEIKLHKI